MYDYNPFREVKKRQIMPEDDVNIETKTETNKANNDHIIDHVAKTHANLIIHTNRKKYNKDGVITPQGVKAHQDLVNDAKQIITKYTNKSDEYHKWFHQLPPHDAIDVAVEGIQEDETESLFNDDDFISHPKFTPDNYYDEPESKGVRRYSYDYPLFEPDEDEDYRTARVDAKSAYIKHLSSESKKSIG